MADNVRETRPPEPPSKPPEVPKPTEQPNRPEARDHGRLPESQWSAQQDTRNAVQAEHAKATDASHRFDSVASGYDRVDRTDLPQDWMRSWSEDFAARTGGTNRPTEGAYRYRDDVGSDPTPVSSSPRDRSVGNDLDFGRLAADSGRPLRGEPRNAGDAEMRAAKQMRQDERSRLAEENPGPREPSHMDVVLDNSTCGSREFDQRMPLTCDQLLPGAMPAGDTMTVYGSVDGGQTFFRKTFTGTGELIR